MKLDRSKPFGKIAGDLFIPEGCDRPAAYEQDGMFFDAHDRLIEAGKSVSIVPNEDDDEQLPTNVADLLRAADTLHHNAFKKAAKAVLGPTCPAGKAAIIEALRAAQGELEARAEKRAKERAAATPQVKPTATSSVDLAGWARGQKEYLWGDVRKAIKLAFGRDVSERDDAVEFLIGQSVISAAEARQDVLRGA